MGVNFVMATYMHVNMLCRIF